MEMIFTPDRPRNRYDGQAEAMEMDLKMSFRVLGVHPHCLYCREKCKQYHAPNSKIWCEKRGWSGN